MILTLNRTDSDAYGTFGILTGKGQQYLRTCEAPWRKYSLDGRRAFEYGVPFESCVPRGTYSLIWHESHKYGWRWHLKGDGVHLTRRSDTERFSCLFHTANHPSQVQGCIALGMWFGSPVEKVGVGSSLNALKAFESWLETEKEHQLIIR